MSRNEWRGRIVIDEDGFRLNVGIILANGEGQVFWAKRCGQNAWQFPQGGINPSESLSSAMFRELYEETGLQETDVRIVDVTKGWLRYRLPRRLVRHDNHPVCIGQKQKWFLLEFNSCEENIRLNHLDTPEFDEWRWTSYWYPLGQVVMFKREVYRKALQELAPAWINMQNRRQNRK